MGKDARFRTPLFIIGLLFDLALLIFFKYEGFFVDSFVKLVGADLTKAELNRAVLAKADLSRATLVGAYLKRANLRGAILGKASVSDADFDLAELHGSDLSQTIGLVQDQIERACGDTTTKLPPGIKPPATWPCTTTDD